MKKSKILQRSISLFLTAIMVISLLTGLALQGGAAAAETDPVELLTDGSFDTPTTIMTDGNLSSLGIWTSMSWASVLSEPENARTGNGLAHLVYNSPDLPAGEYPTIYQDVAVEPNTDYQVSFYTKRWSTSDANAPLYYGYRNALADVWTPVMQLSIDTVGPEYQKISFSFNSGALTRVRIFAFLCSMNTGAFGGYHIDDFSMQKFVYDGGMLEDASFNNDMTIITDGTLPSLGTWTSMSWASALKEPENAHTGNGLAHLVFNSPALPANEYPTIYQDVAVTPGADYEVSFYVKKWATVDRNAPLYYGYRNALADVWTPVEQFMAEDIGTTYQKISFTFNAANLTRVRIFAFVCSINTGDAGGYHLDDFFMRELPDDNLLKDGSFNNTMTVMTDGTLPSIGTWTSMSWASTVNEPENAHTGAGLANLVYNAPGLAAGEFPTIYQDVDVEQDTIYSLSFYAKCWTAPGAPVQPLYYGLRNALEDIWTPVRQLSVEDLTGGYQKITLLFDSQQMTRVRIFAFTESIATQEIGGYHLDDFKLVRLCAEADCPHAYAETVTAPTCIEDGFTTYTCTICDNTYTDSIVEALGHSYVNGICEYCGQPDPDAVAIKVKSAYLRINEDINIVFTAEVPDGCENPYMVIDFLNGSYKIEDYTVNSDGLYCFEFKRVLPMYLGENITATVYAAKDGETVSDVVADYSVKAYCVSMIEKNPDDTALKTLLSDILVYGAAAQTYTGYKTDALVTSGLDLTPSTFSTLEKQKATFTGEKSDDVDWTSATVCLSNALGVRFYFTAESVDGLTVDVTIGDRTETFDADDFGVAPVSGKYFVTLRDIKATEFDEAVTASFKQGGNAIGRTVSYSVNTYISGVQDYSDASVAALAQALYNYGASAVAYSAK